jgi:hypothetical protein
MCFVFLTAGLALFAGCGGEKFQVAPVSGVCNCNGQPLTAGLVVFEPIPEAGADLKESGRAAAGVISEGGTYVLSTFGRDDGAIVGNHRVRVFAPALEDDDAPLTDANRYACGNEQVEQEVFLGKNVIDLNLTYNPPGARRR